MSIRVSEIAASGVLFVSLVAGASGEVTVRLSVDRARNDSNGASASPVLSEDGRWIVFESDATDLVRGDTNGVTDVFVRDRHRGSTERVSVDSGEHEANGASSDPVVSSDGRYVAFTSDADNLVAGDTNHWSDVFVRDRLKGTTVRVSVATGGGQGSEGSFSPSICADGTLVAFVSQAPDLVPGDGNFSWDVFVRDLVAGTTARVSLDSSGGEGNSGSMRPAISADGRFVAFESLAWNLDGNDQNAKSDVYLHDRGTATTSRVSRDRFGGDPNSHSGHPCISGDGSIVAFESSASDLVAKDKNGRSDVFVLDRMSGALERVSVDSSGAEANGDSFGAAVAAAGRWVAFGSTAPDLVPADANGFADVFVHDLQTGVTHRMSAGIAGSESNSDSFDPSVNGNGDNVAFTSFATNLVGRDRNGAGDVFARERCVDEASFAHYGTGWPGTFGIPELLPGNDPELNRHFLLTITNSSGVDTPGVLMIGASKASIPTSAGGTLLVDPQLVVLLSIPPGGTTLDCPLPPDAANCGAELNVQVLELDPGASGSISFSDGLELLFGY